MKNISYVLFIMLLTAASCATSSKNQKKDNDVLIGQGSNQIGIVNDWKNPEFLGGKTTVVKADGIAVVNTRGLADARDRAIEDAKRKSVEQAVGSMVSGEKIAENNRIIQNTIYDKTTGYISGYKVRNEKNTETAYYVTIEAEVGVDMIQDNLQAMGILMDTMNMPMIAVIVVDEYGDVQDSFNVALEKTMATKGFRFVEQKTLSAVIKREQIKLIDAAGSSSADIISKLGIGTGAEVVIMGRADAAPYRAGVLEGTSIKSSRADIAVRAVNVADATVIAQSTYQGAGVGGTDKDAAGAAFVKAGENVGNDLVSQITRKWQDIVQSGTEYTLLITGLNFNEQIAFEKALKNNIRGVKEVFNKGLTGDASKFVVKYLGKSKDLAVDITDKADVMGFEVTVRTFDERTVTISAKKK